MTDLTEDTWFKALDDLNPAHGGKGRYPGVGRWTRHLDPKRLESCTYGFHLARGPQVVGWLAPTLYVAEPCPDHDLVDGGDKWVTCRVRLVERLDRWDESTARLFAADCAEAALLGERASGREPDERSWAAVAAARRFAHGEISRNELAATWDATWAAARDAARDAAGDATGVTRVAARDGARAAARAAARVAARAAGDAARDGARDAARDARAAVRAATWDARAAVTAATWDPTGYAVWAAAGGASTAAGGAQYRRLVLYLAGADLPPVEPLYGKETRSE